MEWTTEQMQQMEEIASEINCPKDFKCFKDEPEEFRQTRNIGIEGYPNCTEPQECEFALPFGEGYLCKCPVRVYIAQNI